MTQRDTRVTIAVALTGGLLGRLVAPCAAQPVEPAARAAAPSRDGAAPASPAATQSSDAALPAAGDAAKPATGDAAKPSAKPGAPLPAGASIKVERTASGAKLFRITEGLLVEGQMQRPNAFLVLQRATVDYDYEALSESFLPRILAATREKPF